MKEKLNYLLGLGLLMAIYLFACSDGSKQEKKESESVAEMPDDNYNSGEVNYLDLGRTIAEQSQATLARNLVTAINTGGTAYAVNFCNAKAIPITDSMGKALNATVKRVSDRLRNTLNQANQNELNQIARMKQEMNEGGTPKPGLLEINGKMVGYYAIVTNELCTKCHGTKNETIEPATLKRIQTLYPHDKAIGYTANELRGMWVVEMDNK